MHFADVTPPRNHKPDRNRKDPKLRVRCQEQMILTTTGYASKDFNSSFASPEPSTSRLVDVKKNPNVRAEMNGSALLVRNGTTVVETEIRGCSVVFASTST
jgi:hypothetical protein